ncbi:MAG: hypothetical protein BJ554DRAFT_910, partial [Olpidium bornovanus]
MLIRTTRLAAASTMETPDRPYLHSSGPGAEVNLISAKQACHALRQPDSWGVILNPRTIKLSAVEAETNPTRNEEEAQNPLVYFDTDRAAIDLAAHIKAKLVELRGPLCKRFEKRLLSFTPVMPDKLPLVAQLSSTAEHEINLEPGA